MITKMRSKSKAAHVWLCIRIFSEDDPCIFKKKPRLPQQKIISTPYGGRLQYTLPKGNTLMVHLKDKQLIRHKKRWSQVTSNIGTGVSNNSTVLL